MPTVTFRYYVTQRPPFMGCIPRGAMDVVFLDDCPIIADIGRRAWGYAVYDHKLSRKEIEDYELTPQSNV